MKLKNSKYKVLTENGFKDFTGLNISNHNKGLLIEFDDNTNIICTYNHLIRLNNKNFIEARLLLIGDMVTNKKVIGIKKLKFKNKKFYDLLNVQDTHHYITNGIISHNCAFVPETIWSEFWKSSLPTISASKKSKVILVSTPNGKNHFYKFYADSKAGVGAFHVQEIRWDDVPKRTPKWKKEQLKVMSQEEFEQEYECSFIAVTNSLVHRSVLDAMPIKKPLKLQDELFTKVLKKFYKYINIYEHPQEGEKYLIGVDMSKIGKSQTGDAVAININKMNKKYGLPLEQVATTFIQDDSISYLEVPYLIYHLGRYYNEAILFIENNGEGGGQEVANKIANEFFYENIYYEGRFPGFRTTRKKIISCNNLRTLLSSDKMLIRDSRTREQLYGYVKKKKGSYEGIAGDDLVSALLASIHFLNLDEDELDAILDDDDFPTKEEIIKEIFRNRQPKDEEEMAEEEEAELDFFNNLLKDMDEFDIEETQTQNWNNWNENYTSYSNEESMYNNGW